MTLKTSDLCDACDGARASALAWRGYGRVQSGRTQNYAMTMAVGVFGLVCLYLVLS